MRSKTIGIVGAGQLGRMLALAGYPLGIECRFLDRSAESPAGQLAAIELGELDDAAAVARLASAVDVLTVEIENVAVAPLEAVQARVPVFPPPASIAAAQDRLNEKLLFHSLEIPTTPFVGIERDDDLRAAAATLGFPVVLKARRMGYDGRGQRISDSLERLIAGWQELGRPAAIAEAWVEFERELSLIGVRGARGETAFYPLAENVHRGGILESSVAPYPDDALQRQAEQWLTAIMNRYDYRGVLTVEFFATRAGLVANEMAPRVHNSGHWTIEGAETSQFENHLRALAGWPLGDTRPRGHAAMLNLIGELPPADALLAFPGAHLHVYGKSPRAGRKLGHCTIVDRDRSELQRRLAALRGALAKRQQ
jgi:5-(carboxyamino)imidazole ribonucleotide synthase